MTRTATIFQTVNGNFSRDALNRALQTIRRWLSSAWFAYLTIFLLQLKVIWNIWAYRDLTSGDTSSYFTLATSWFKELGVQYHWSPLYTAFYGTLLHLSPDAFVVTTLHRVIIVMLLALMVLALMRRLLPNSIAWFVAAWWVILPINFNSLYEVHLFAVILPLAAVLVALGKPSVWRRGTALGLLLTAMFLVRNEVAIAVVLLGLVSLVWEIRQIRLGGGKPVRMYLLGYGLPILLACLSFAFFYSRTLIKPTEESLSSKHTLNVCQIYAFSYKQRHSDWTKSPWLGCQELMTRDFGKPLPTLIEAIKINPNAMLEHFQWNISLIPSGLQAALFNAASGHVNPDYPPTVLDAQWVIIPSVLIVGICVFAILQVYRNRHYWWDYWLKDRIWGWITLGSLAAVMLVVMPMQRPRPSYMFMLTLFIMALTGMSVFVLVHKITKHREELHKLVGLAPIVAILTIVLVPPFFEQVYQPLYYNYKKLQPFKNVIGLQNTSIVSPGYGQDLCNYYAQTIYGCIGLGYRVIDKLPSDMPLGKYLDSQQPPVVVLCVETSFFSKYGARPAVQAFLANPGAENWQLVGQQDNWRFYVSNAVRGMLN